MYLYVGSILAIMCIYVSVIVDNCPSITASKENLTKQDDPEVGSITSFGTLKRAHISRSKTSRTSFYLRVGALGGFEPFPHRTNPLFIFFFNDYSICCYVLWQEKGREKPPFPIHTPLSHLLQFLLD